MKELNVHDTSYFVSLDKEGKVLNKSSQVCFGFMNSNSVYKDPEVETLIIYVSHNSSRASTFNLVDEMAKCGLIHSDWFSYGLVSRLNYGLRRSPYHSGVKRFIRMSFKIKEVSLQRMYLIYLFLRTLQNEPITAHVMRVIKDLPLDFLQKIAIANSVGIKCKKHYKVKVKAGAYHTLMSYGANLARTTMKEFLERLDKVYPMKGVKTNYRIADNFMGYPSYGYLNCLFEYFKDKDGRAVGFSEVAIPSKNNVVNYLNLIGVKV